MGLKFYKIVCIAVVRIRTKKLLSDHYTTKAKIEMGTI